MKPFRIFLFGLSVFLVLSVISVGFQIYKPSILGYSIKYQSFSSVINQAKPQYKDISHIISIGKTISDSLKPTPLHDSTKTLSHKLLVGTKSNINTDSLKTICHQMELPPGKDTVLYPFFKEISSLQNSSRLIRILHYGDSQIEGDRITAYLRNQLQSKFGGSGIGLMPVVAANPSSISYFYDISDNWKKYSPLQGAEYGIHNRYGALVNFAMISPAGSIFTKEKELNGWIDLKYPNISYPLAQQSEQFRIFYGFNKSPMMIEVTQNKSVLEAEIVPPSSSLQEIRWKIASPRYIHVSFKSAYSPEIYGISMDGGHGIAVDNIPLRGSSGLEFTRIDPGFLRNFYKMLNAKLLILQFGVNVVPNVTSSYDYYERQFLKQLVTLKQLNPDISIIVIGVSDVSKNGENGYESFPNIEKIRDAQKKAAFDAGCAFWDCFEAMGGHNSMPSWVFANPPLAQKDFVHFNPMGAKIIAEMFYRSFMLEYERYLAGKQKKDDVVMINN